MKKEVKEFLESLDSLKLIPKSKVSEMIRLHKALFNKPDRYYNNIKSCSSCNAKVLSDLFVYAEKPNKKYKEAEVKETNKRRQICERCPASRNKGVFMTCGEFGVSQEINGLKTCGCSIFIKSKFKNLHCPNELW